MARRDFPFRNRQQELDRLRQNEPSSSEVDTSPVAPQARICERFTYTDPNHSSQILSGLYKQWSTGQFLDVTVVIGGVSIKAHGSVLSALSRYFENLFVWNVGDNRTDIITLNNSSLHGDTIKQLITFAYTGSLEIMPENVQDLLFAADYLCIDSVVGACCSYLEKNMTYDNCVDILSLAATLGQLRLEQSVASFMIANFERLMHDRIYLKMDPKALLTLLEKDEIVLKKDNYYLSSDKLETKLLQLLETYVSKRSEDVNSQLRLRLLSSGIRLLLLPKEVISRLLSSAWIRGSPECIDLLNRLLSSDVSREERERWERPRYHLIEYEETYELASIPSNICEGPPEPFDDRKLFRAGQCFFVAGMKVYLRSWDGKVVIGGLLVFYNTGQSILHGSDGYGLREHEFHLDPDERITTVRGHCGWMVDQLEFTTNKRKTYGPYGGDGGGSFNFTCPCNDAYLACIAGSIDFTQHANAVRKLRFVWGYPKNSVHKKPQKKPGKKHA